MRYSDYSEMVRIAYDNSAKKYHTNFKNEMEEKEFDRLFLDNFSNSLHKHSLICDAGCGPSGHIGKYLFDKGHKIKGIDISPECIQIARDYNPELDFEVMDMANMNFASNSFDAIISFYSIMYTPKKYLDLIISEFHRVLKPNGVVLIVVKKGYLDTIENNYWDEGNPVHYCLFQEDEMNKLLLMNKFKSVTTQTCKI
jgi:SAM-dependent methyltransferase